MGYNSRLHPFVARDGNGFGSVATDGSENIAIFSPWASGQVLGARFVNGTTSTVASGTTAGSSLNLYVYKNASNAASIVASVRAGAVATYGTLALTLSTSTALQRFVNGDVLIAEAVGGAGNDTSQAGAFIEVSYMYAYDDDAQV